MADSDTSFLKLKGADKMKIEEKLIKGACYSVTIRCAEQSDANELSKIRVDIDGETEFLDREQGEDYLSDSNFEEMIHNDLIADRSLFLVAEVNEKIVGYARCIGKKLSRYMHQADFGICILQQYCGQGIGKDLIKYILEWSDTVGIEKITLSVVETNMSAISLYKRFGFVQEGLLIKDRKHRDGNYYNTVIMGRFKG